MPEQLQVDLRDTRGKHNARRMRIAGRVPAVLYGHGQETLSLSVASEAVAAVIRHGGHVVDLRGAVSESALIREFQWNTWGTEVLHVDFARVSADETIEITVPIELRGEAPGLKAGGILEHLLHEMDIECRATDVPDRLIANVNHLQLDQKLTVADLALPEGAKCHAEPDDIVVQCIVPAELPEEEEAAAPAEGEPEVIGARKEEGTEEGKEKE
jgi:large subunit ribosomal protein L25